MEKLPDEVLLEVFELLPGKSLKNAALVCKRWNEVIGVSSSTMNKFQLSLRRKFVIVTECNVFRETKTITSDEFEEIMSLRRKFRSIKANLMEAEENEKFVHLQIMQHFGQNIKKLSLVGASLNFKNLLVNMPQLESFKLQTCISCCAGDETVQPAELKKLKKLYFFGSDHEILKHFRGPNITFASFYRVHLTSHTAKCFIKSLNRLEVLEIDGTEKMFLERPYDEFPFKLKNVFLNFWPSYGKHLKTCEEQVVEFLKLQSGSLEELTISFDPSAAISKTILSNLRRLRRLKIHDEMLQANSHFFKMLKPNSSIKQIVLHYDLCAEVIKKISAEFPNLEVITQKKIKLKSNLL